MATLALLWMMARVWVFRSPSLDIEAAPSLTRFGAYRPDMDLRQAFESLPPAGGDHTNLTLLPDNPEAWAARWRMLAGTRTSLDISYFILREDVFGAAFLGHLLHKANEGVRIRLLLDSQGTVMSFTSALGIDWLDTLANTRGIQVKLFRPLTTRYLEAFATINPVAAVASEHDKIMVSDRTLGMIGGRNISAEYFADPADMPDAFQDVDIVMQGENVARGLRAAFEAQYKSNGAKPVTPERINLTSYAEDLLLAYRAMDAWVKGYALDAATAARIKSLGLSWSDDLAKFPRLRGTWSQVSKPEAEAETRLLDSPTRLSAQADTIAVGLSRLVKSSRETILIQSPYVVLSEDAVAALIAAGRRGVSIALYTNSPVSSDNAISQAFFMQQWPGLLAQVKGLRLFVTGEPRTLHSKLMVFDDQIAVVGTYNLDPVSMGINSEIMAVTWSHSFARRVGARPRGRLARGVPLVYEYTIKRDRKGQPVMDEHGQPIVTFGPENHATPDQWRKAQAVLALLRAADKVPGISPLF